ncbi:MAG: right-handed parallel beta-helix repeat-containing protein [Planctomycetaceae bacterium]
MSAVAPEDKTQPGRFVVEHPTLHNLGFEWAISGDANRNATVAVRFRKVGDPEWREALPLLRMGGESVYRRREHLEYTVPSGFAGSILNLEPGTAYECRFELSDPDGVSGEAVQTATVSTRREPQPFKGGRVLHVYPPDHDGERLEPHFSCLLEAYYGAGLGDWSVVWERRAQPGDTILIHAGLYKNDRRNYVDPQMTPFDGTMSLTLKGTPEKPITIKSAGDGEVIFDGDGNHRVFDVMASQHHIFDGLTIRNTDVGIFAGQKEVLGAIGLTVKNCRFENIGFGVWTEYAGSRDFYIADNLFLGRDDRFRLIGWTGPLWASAGKYGSHLLTSYYAIKVYGPGHVIEHNSIAYFHDGIGISTYGTPPEDPELQASSIDICHNDLHMLNDDFVETDGACHNVRVMYNRGVNAAQGGYSAQPAFGGPVYFIGNLLYHVPSGVSFKFSAKPAGLLVYHNTIIGEQTIRDPSSNMHWRNNLFLGRDTPGRGIMTWGNASHECSSDYNGFRPNAGVAEQFAWLQPPAGQTLYEPADGDWQLFATLGELRRATGQEAHGIEVDFNDFESLAPPDPAGRHAVYHAVDLSFRLKSTSRAVDAGVVLPTVNDGFEGQAPDLGALEAGGPAPVYGPRWLKRQPFYR